MYAPQIEVLNTYNWDNHKELMRGHELDLSRQLPKESPLLITLAEQLTLMEFAVYAAVERRELLNCNWKKKDKEAMAPNLWRLIRRTNAVSVCEGGGRVCVCGGEGGCVCVGGGNQAVCVCSVCRYHAVCFLRIAHLQLNTSAFFQRK